MTAHDDRAPWDARPQLLLKNAETISIIHKPFSAVEITGVTLDANGNIVHEVKTPSDDDVPVVFVGPKAIHMDEYGAGMDGEIVFARGGATAGDTVGVTSGSSDLATDRRGFVVLSGHTINGESIIRVMRNAHKKLLIRFTLDSAMTTSNASQSATITDQYGPGIVADTATTITAHNMETSTASTYIFAGDEDDAGLAIWDHGVNYRIIQMECA